MWATGRQIGEEQRSEEPQSTEETRRLHRGVVLKGRIKDEDEGRIMWGHFKYP